MLSKLSDVKYAQKVCTVQKNDAPAFCYRNAKNSTYVDVEPEYRYGRLKLDKTIT